MIELTGGETDARERTERFMRQTRRDFDRRIDEIRGQLKEKGPEAIERAQKSLEELREDMRNEWETHERFHEEVAIGRREVREHPLLAVGLAVTFGLVLGVLLGRH